MHWRRLWPPLVNRMTKTKKSTRLGGLWGTGGPAEICDAICNDGGGVAAIAVYATCRGMPLAGAVSQSPSFQRHVYFSFQKNALW